MPATIPLRDAVIKLQMLLTKQGYLDVCQTRERRIMEIRREQIIKDATKSYGVRGEAVPDTLMADLAIKDAITEENVKAAATKRLREYCRSLLQAFVNDSITSRSAWSNLEPTVYKEQIKSFGVYLGVTEEHYETYSKQIEQTIVEFLPALEDDLDAYLGPHDTWFIVDVKQTGDFLIITKGLDYRVYDWHRRMESGEWTME